MPRQARSPAAARLRVRALLQDDHRAIAAAFAAVEALPQPVAAAALEAQVDVALELLERHAWLEEEVLYPAIRPRAGERIDEAEVEHASMAALVAQLRAGGPADAKYLARFKVLGEYLRHHAAEEEGALFAALERKAMPWDEIEERLRLKHAPAPEPPPARKRAPRGDQKT
jgi:hemerythrin-like domain-containing protein